MEKRCERCGAVRDVRPRERRCKKVQMGAYCWGRLVRVPPPKRVRPVRRDERPQDRAQRKLEQARRMVAKKTRELARVVAALTRWERAAERWARRASMTDEEVAAERRAMADRAARRRARLGRGITLGPLSVL